MMALFYKLLASLTGRNLKSTPTYVIKEQLLERRALPVGMTEFEEWSDRIISGALLTATPESQKFTLATTIMHLGPQESHKEDAYFIHTLRKAAANQIAHAKMQELKDADNKRRSEAALKEQ